MADIAEGVFITNLYGSGVDLITGDYSLGAAGFLIENGKITVPISSTQQQKRGPQRKRQGNPGNARALEGKEGQQRRKQHADPAQQYGGNAHGLHPARHGATHQAGRLDGEHADDDDQRQRHARQRGQTHALEVDSRMLGRRRVLIDQRCAIGDM